MALLQHLMALQQCVLLLWVLKYPTVLISHRCACFVLLTSESHQHGAAILAHAVAMAIWPCWSAVHLLNHFLFPMVLFCWQCIVSRLCYDYISMLLTPSCIKGGRMQPIVSLFVYALINWENVWFIFQSPEQSSLECGFVDHDNCHSDFLVRILASEFVAAHVRTLPEVGLKCYFWTP